MTLQGDSCVALLFYFMRDFMVIEWKNDNVKMIPTKKNGTLFLLPGLNEVDSKLWDEVDKEFGLTKGVYAQLIDVKTEKKSAGEGKVKEVKEFKEMSNTKAKEMIANCFSVKTLTVWLNDDERADIRYALEKRIDEIKDDKVGLGKKLGKGN
jgi:hypothetical protein